MTAVKQYEFIVFGTYTKMGRDVVVYQMHPISVIDSIFPIVGLLTVEYRCIV